MTRSCFTWSTVLWNERVMIEIGERPYKLCNEPSQCFFCSDQGKPYIPHLVGSSQHLESKCGTHWI